MARFKMIAYTISLVANSPEVSELEDTLLHFITLATLGTCMYQECTQRMSKAI